MVQANGADQAPQQSVTEAQQAQSDHVQSEKPEGQPTEAKPKGGSETKYEVEWNGQRIALTQDELLKHAQMGVDYTKKTQALADERKRLEESSARFQQFQEFDAWLTDPRNAPKADKIRDIILGKIEEDQPQDEGPDLGLEEEESSDIKVLLKKTMSRLEAMEKAEEERRKSSEEASKKAKLDSIRKQVLASIEGSEVLKDMDKEYTFRSVVQAMQFAQTEDPGLAIKFVEANIKSLLDKKRGEWISSKEKDAETTVSDSPKGGVPHIVPKWEPKVGNLKHGHTRRAVTEFLKNSSRE